MKRRTVVQLAAMLASPGWVLAQTSRRFRLGLLLAGNETTARPIAQALLAGLRDRGYVVGDNLVLDIRSNLMSCWGSKRPRARSA